MSNYTERFDEMKSNALKDIQKILEIKNDIEFFSDDVRNIPENYISFYIESDLHNFYDQIVIKKIYKRENDIYIYGIDIQQFEDWDIDYGVDISMLSSAEDITLFEIADYLNNNYK